MRSESVWSTGKGGRLSGVFAKFARNGLYQGGNPFVPIYSHMPAAPHFTSGMSSAHHSEALFRQQSMNMYPFWEMMRQQQEFQRQQHEFQRQQLEFQRQQQEMYKDHNGVMQNMFKNFDMAFKSIMSLVTKVTGANQETAHTAPQPHYNTQPHAQPHYTMPYHGEEKAVFEPTVANDPIKVQVDPNSRKIVRISTN